MEIQFFKYQGTGNDFVILDNRSGSYTQLTTQEVNAICDRRYGIGADGLMLLNTREGYDFEMIYYNADGRPSTMCGNGGRCLVKFAWHQGIRKNSYHFIAADGDHEAEIDDDGTVALKMKDVKLIKDFHGDFVLDTGSPHYVKMVSDVMEMDVFRKGTDIRNSQPFAKEGINVNFVEQKKEDEIIVRTFERGVEDETYSCGTGVTAAALVCYHNERGFNDVTVFTKGGRLTVEYDRINDDEYENVWLCGPAERVFEGRMTVPA
ncbi:MAG: diaminopimelate epimerase [Candidatus Pseudobacter hemicellulosilyticus]|uniref:Diaminopimelate epimerase n=1 Tax=Candidatus Pseudobacter hemicellulosilyticus TaxID=3121375 RepID=A0AAJ5WM24_9BACT|nr:MAG: diaminopimelate epimerase [Pseudobacter sp.]